jgi:hypothetical protein
MNITFVQVGICRNDLQIGKTGRQDTGQNGTQPNATQENDGRIEEWNWMKWQLAD